MPNGQGQLPADVTFTPPKPDMSDVTFTPPQQTNKVFTPTPESFGSMTGDIALGALKGVGDTASAVGEGLRTMGEVATPMVPHGAGDIIPESGTSALNQIDVAKNIPQQIGKTGEALGEYFLADAGLANVGKLVSVPENVLALMEKYPKASKTILNTMRESSVGAAQGAVKGAPEGRSLEESEAGAIRGAGASLASEGIQALTNADLAKAMINRSAGVTKSMIRYGADPAEALVTEKDLPAFSTLTNKGREAAAITALNKLKPTLDNTLKASPEVLNWHSVLDPVFADARNEIQGIEAMTDEQKVASLNQINTFERNLNAKYPTGQMSPFEMNELKSRIQKWGADFDSKPDATDIVRNMYAEAQGRLKDTVNNTVPGIRELNQRISNLAALKDATHETILAERAGLGPLSGFGTARKVEAAVGHAAPVAARIANSGAVSPRVIGPIGGVAGETLARFIFRASDGSIHSVPNDQDSIEKAHAIDPGLTALPSGTGKQQPE